MSSRPTRFGPAKKGSRYCLQRYVEFSGRALAELIVRSSTALAALDPAEIRWVSPVREANYLEYRDDFLRVIGLDQHEKALRQFWPLNGPQWDGLATFRSSGRKGVFLVEAKAHPQETLSDCGATNPVSIQLIGERLEEVRQFMGARPVDWTKRSYQLANRLAHLYFLSELCGVSAFLVLVNFVNDRSHKPTSIQEWQRHPLTGNLGIHAECRLLDRIVTVYPEAV